MFEQFVGVVCLGICLILFAAFRVIEYVQYILMTRWK